MPAFDDHQLTIASAVEEQTATARIAATIGAVSGAADATSQALGQTRAAVDELSRMASDLRTAVSHFSY